MLTILNYMKETEQETFDRIVVGINSVFTFEIAKIYHTERKRIEVEMDSSFTCPFSRETFEKNSMDKIEAYAIFTNKVNDEPVNGEWFGGLTNLAFFNTKLNALDWQKRKFKPKQ